MPLVVELPVLPGLEPMTVALPATNAPPATLTGVMKRGAAADAALLLLTGVRLRSGAWCLLNRELFGNIMVVVEVCMLLRVRCCLLLSCQWHVGYGQRRLCKHNSAMLLYTHVVACIWSLGHMQPYQPPSMYTMESQIH